MSKGLQVIAPFTGPFGQREPRHQPHFNSYADIDWDSGEVGRHAHDPRWALRICEDAPDLEPTRSAAWRWLVRRLMPRDDVDAWLDRRMLKPLSLTA